MPKLSALTAKAVPTTADELIITDKADSNATKRITANNLPLSAAAVSGLAAKLDLSGGTMTGDLTLTSNSPFINLNDTGSDGDDFQINVNHNNFYILADRDGDGDWEDPHPLKLEADTNKAYTFGNEIVTLDASGNLLVGKTTAGIGNEGVQLSSAGQVSATYDGGTSLIINRLTNDGELVSLRQDSTQEGSISVSGTTVSYNGGHLARWSRMLDGSKPENLLKGTVMTNLDDMIEWAYDETPEVLWAAGDGLPEGVSVGDVKVEGVAEVIDEEGNIVTEAVEEVLWTETDGLPEGVSIGDVKVEYKPAGVEDNEQLNHTAISSVEGDKDVAGVFIAWDDDDDYNDYHLAMAGDVIIRIAEGVEVKRGDLLISAGDGTAKPQDDDIQRSSTVAKVASTVVSCTYDDGSYCVPCVLK